MTVFRDIQFLAAGPASERRRSAAEATAMGRIVQWLQRVPLWVWLFIVVSQVLMFASRAYHIPDLDRSIERFGDRPERRPHQVDSTDTRPSSAGRAVASVTRGTSTFSHSSQSIGAPTDRARKRWGH